MCVWKSIRLHLGTSNIGRTLVKFINDSKDDDGKMNATSQNEKLWMCVCVCVNEFCIANLVWFGPFDKHEGLLKIIGASFSSLRNFYLCFYENFPSFFIAVCSFHSVIGYGHLFISLLDDAHLSSQSRSKYGVFLKFFFFNHFSFACDSKGTIKLLFS